MQERTIVITDLDGTLLDAATYSFDAALPALDLLRRREVPLVICSSKTRAEIEVYRERLGNRHPFIAENGGGIYIPRGYFPFAVDAAERGDLLVIELGRPYAEVRAVFERLRDELRSPVRGFGDMTPQEVGELTGLTPAEAALAHQREHCEPFIFTGPPDERFLQAIEASGLRWTQGRFFHIMGNHHKGKAVDLLRELYQRDGTKTELIGLGDSLNDMQFLLTVDRPALVRRQDGTHDPRIAIPWLYQTEGIGPAGWNEAVLRFLDDHA
jgi:mannosyl-3-phosphoglycerate phosphatase family protein